MLHTYIDTPPCVAYVDLLERFLASFVSVSQSVVVVVLPSSFGVRCLGCRCRCVFVLSQLAARKLAGG